MKKEKKIKTKTKKETKAEIIEKNDTSRFFKTRAVTSARRLQKISTC